MLGFLVPEFKSIIRRRRLLRSPAIVKLNYKDLKENLFSIFAVLFMKYLHKAALFSKQSLIHLWRTR
jgi:hypothetical protein